MCLWVLTACLGLLPGNPSPAVVVPGQPSPFVVPSPELITIVTTSPPSFPPPTLPTLPPTILTLPPTTIIPAPTTTAVPPAILNPALSGTIIPLVICSNSEIVCVVNPHDLSGKTGPYRTQVGTTLTPAAVINPPPIAGYSAQMPSFDTAVKFPRFRRNADLNFFKRVKYSWKNVQEVDREHRIKKRQFCGCVPIGTCSANENDVIIGTPGVECLADQDYCCGNTVDIATKDSCGVIKTVRSSPRTTGTGQASDGKNPWQGVLLTQTDYVSGTVLIDEFNVLTVAHKVLQYVTPGTPVNLKVRMGDWNATQRDSSLYQEYSVSKVFSHPNFFPKTLQNDIAVLRLSSAVPFTPSAGAVATINRACLPPTASTIYTGQRCVVAGVGHQVFGPKGTIQTTIKMVDVPIVDPARCQKLLRATRLGSYFTLDTSSFICAGGETSKDVCTGDGGSGLVCQVDEKWILVGLVSWGIGCGSPNVPGVYVNVASYLPWINQQIAAS
ncbi:unnamed protein product [Arctia plantaginis]|uniref:Peptidase S1 domain-containing protein n=1 Tax=Arctia plantaginis TaxID=874455 RepID=A0A8S1A8H1_ARCPL|nr:unnamed protein product [Arctia plantaginis]